MTNRAVISSKNWTHRFKNYDKQKCPHQLEESLRGIRETYCIEELIFNASISYPERDGTFDSYIDQVFYLQYLRIIQKLSYILDIYHSVLCKLMQTQISYNHKQIIINKVIRMHKYIHYVFKCSSLNTLGRCPLFYSAYSSARSVCVKRLNYMEFSFGIFLHTINELRVGECYFMVNS